MQILLGRAQARAEMLKLLNWQLALLLFAPTAQAKPEKMYADAGLDSAGIVATVFSALGRPVALHV